MLALHYLSIVMKRELSIKAKLSIFKTVIFVSILAYNGHESLVISVSERERWQAQASKMMFLRKIEGMTLFNKVRGSEILKSLNIESLRF